MSTARHHADWLSLVEVSGPFVSLPVLLRAFPQGLEPRDPAQAKQLRSAYEEWQDHPTAPGKQRAWVLHVLCELLGYPANQIAEGQSLPAGLETNMAEQGETLRPDFALIGPAGNEAAGQAQLLICSYPADQLLDKPVIGKHWKATPATRMMELLHGTNVPLGLVANGEQWMLVYAPRGETTGYASWYGDLWLDEPITLRAFQSLLGVRRFFGVAADSTLLSLLKESASDQQEVTDQLGYQVREAVEVLVQSFDVIHQESQGVALKGIPPTSVYDAALTIMMRLVFLFSAEERGLLHLGKPLYDDNYAISTLQEQLQEVADRNGEEVLERRYDAWTRLLASFRAVHGGIQHQDLLMQAYGGSLFDPDRYPFLEGRAAGSTWGSQSADPLPVNNRVVLHLLNSLQRLRTKAGGAAETRRVSFRALGVEQIGHVYEGLLDHTAQRATEVVLGIRGTRSKEPEIALSTLEQLLAKGEDALLEHLKEQTGRSLPAIRKELNNNSVLDDHKLLVACLQDEALLARLRPFAGLIREDSSERPWVVLPGSVFVTAGTTRRSTGTHYTPPSLTEPIVRHTLEPLVYSGPAEGIPKEEWKLKSPKEILALKVCDMAMGSGAFLVQACRYLAERLVEAWENEEKAHPGQVLITPEGKFSEGAPSERLVPAEAAERIAIARRVVADRCLYGVDINPMAVEMAKLSMWLITVDKNRPFTFLDHAFKHGDSLLGITSLDQLERFSLRRDGGKQQAFATLNLRQRINEAQRKREELELMPSDTPDQIAEKAVLHADAELLMTRLIAASDILVAFEMRGFSGSEYESERQNAADKMMTLWAVDDISIFQYAENLLRDRKCMHWPLAFPEILSRGGFDAIVGNPPFLGGTKASSDLGVNYTNFLHTLFEGWHGKADLVGMFFRRFPLLISNSGFAGFLSTAALLHGETKACSLAYLVPNKFKVYRARRAFSWPGVASVSAVYVHLANAEYGGTYTLDDVECDGITSSLEPGNHQQEPVGIASGATAFLGVKVSTKNAPFSPTQISNKIIEEIVIPIMGGDDLYRRRRHDVCDVVFDPDKLTIENAHLLGFSEAIEVTIANMQHSAPARELRKIQRSTKYTIACAETSARNLIFDILPNSNGLVSHKVVAFPSDDIGLFAVLQSSVHIAWAWKYGMRRGDSLNYSPKRCAATFPVCSLNDNLRNTAIEYHELRERCCNNFDVTLTGCYNLFHDPDNKTPEIKNLRNLHAEIDKLVITAYGFSNIKLNHGFYETQQGIRFTISEDARHEVLDRLLELNHQRHAEEVAKGLHGKKSAKKSTVTMTTNVNPQDDLFGLEPIDSIQASSHEMVLGPIAEYLRANPGWHSKDEILTATGFPDNRWNGAIRELLDSGQVNRQGEKRGAKYRLSGTNY
jgi:hypothetical protein